MLDRTHVPGVFLLFLMLAGCGGTGYPVPPGGGGGGGGGGGLPCGGACAPGFTCSANICSLDPSRLWLFTLTTGTVTEKHPDGDSWDTFGGLPDPQVCLTINGDRRCSSVKQDTLMPSWYETFPAQTATGLLGGIKVEYVDSDVSANDPICGTAVVEVDVDNFRSGRWGAHCNAGTISATLALK